jgi:hypothetical protein
MCSAGKGVALAVVEAVAATIQVNRVPAADECCCSLHHICQFFGSMLSLSSDLALMQSVEWVQLKSQEECKAEYKLQSVTFLKFKALSYPGVQPFKA